MDLEAEALRLNDRYLEEVVIAFDLCPWAEKAVREGHVRRTVIADTEAAPESVLTFIDALEAPPCATIDIGLAIFPKLALSAAAFDRFAERVRKADRIRRPDAAMPAFVIAAFHPEAAVSFETPAQLVSWIRRTPDPTLQLVRNATLESVQRGSPKISEEIGDQNFAAVRGAGPERIDAVIRAIQADRR